jgi:hypothetical protein
LLLLLLLFLLLLFLLLLLLSLLLAVRLQAEHGELCDHLDGAGGDSADAGLPQREHCGHGRVPKHNRHT